MVKKSSSGTDFDSSEIASAVIWGAFPLACKLGGVQLLYQKNRNLICSCRAIPPKPALGMLRHVLTPERQKLIAKPPTGIEVPQTGFILVRVISQGCSKASSLSRQLPHPQTKSLQQLPSPTLLHPESHS